MNSIYKIILLVLVFIVVYSCSEIIHNGPKQVAKFSDLMSISCDSAIKMYGCPDVKDNFPLGGYYYPYRKQILTKVDANKTEESIIWIDELSWEKDSIHYFTIWYQRYMGILVPIDTLTRIKSLSE